MRHVKGISGDKTGAKARAEERSGCTPLQATLRAITLVDAGGRRSHILSMTDNIFSGTRIWTGAASRQAAPTDIPEGPREGEIVNVLATRYRTGKTTVRVTWPVEDRVNLSSHEFVYHSPRAALDAGWILGDSYQEDADRMDRMRRTQR